MLYLSFQARVILEFKSLASVAIEWRRAQSNAAFATIRRKASVSLAAFLFCLTAATPARGSSTNNVATNAQGVSVMGSDHNRVHLLTASGAEAWPELTKTEVARRLVDRIAASFGRIAA
jgi:hypothetical protein